MDKIQKLFRKISAKDREVLIKLIERLTAGSRELNIAKIKGTDFFRVKQGVFRIIYHRENGEIIIDNLRMRNDNAYKNI